MRLANWAKNALLAVGLCALLGVPALARQDQQGSSQQQSGDPVADAARKAREQQKAAPKPKKVYTEDDIPPRTGYTDPAAKVPGADADAQATDAKPQGAKAADNDAKDKPEDPETMWRKRFQQQRAKIATAEQELDILERELDKSNVQYYSDPTKALNEQFSRKDINDKTAKIDQKKQDIANLKQQLSDMEDELRKSGGNIGWSR
jgi:hypothetical protein